MAERLNCPPFSLGIFVLQKSFRDQSAEALQQNGAASFAPRPNNFRLLKFTWNLALTIWPKPPAQRQNLLQEETEATEGDFRMPIAPFIVLAFEIYLGFGVCALGFLPKAMPLSMATLLNCLPISRFCRLLEIYLGFGAWNLGFLPKAALGPPGFEPGTKGL